MGQIIGVLVASLIAGLFFGELRRAWDGGSGRVGVLVIVAAGLGIVARVLMRRRALMRQPWAPVAPPVAAPPVAATTDEPRPAGSTHLERGVQDIRVTDRGFDPTRFAGYAAMLFRDVRCALTARDVGVLRDRVTPEMYRELSLVCERLRTSSQSNRVDDVEIRPEVTEAWQDGDRDYVTAYITGSMVDYTVDDATGDLVDGSPVTPTPVEQFLTFTRPAGLNFWMLSAVQGA